MLARDVSFKEDGDPSVGVVKFGRFFKASSYDRASNSGISQRVVQSLS
jgi:hypothetical protein